MADPKAKYLQSGSGSHDILQTFSGDNRDALGFWLWFSIWIKPGGLCGVFTDWRQLPTVCLGIQSGGWVWRGIVPWWKPGARPTQGRWASQCEYLCWGTNGPRSLEGNAYPGFFKANYPSASKRCHPTEKPCDLLSPIPRGGVVLDPFMGSGTTGVASVKTSRGFIGVEMDKHYYDISKSRIEKARSSICNGLPFEEEIEEQELCDSST